MMPKNFQIHLRIETEVIEQLKKQAQDENISLGELCRRKLKQIPILERIESEISYLKKALS